MPYQRKTKFPKALQPMTSSTKATPTHLQHLQFIPTSLLKLISNRIQILLQLMTNIETLIFNHFQIISCPQLERQQPYLRLRATLPHLYPRLRASLPHLYPRLRASLPHLYLQLRASLAHRYLHRQDLHPPIQSPSKPRSRLNRLTADWRPHNHHNRAGWIRIGFW